MRITVDGWNRRDELARKLAGNRATLAQWR